MPKIIKYIEDADLWNWKLPYSHQISAFIRSYNKNFKQWDKFARYFEITKSRKKYVTEGGAILRADARKVEHAVKDAELVELCGHKTLCSNSFHLVSFIGHGLYKKLPPMGIIWSRRKDVIVVSLRSNGKINVAKLAERFGGGGHKESAAFELSPSGKLPWKVISDKIR